MKHMNEEPVRRIGQTLAPAGTKAARAPERKSASDADVHAAFDGFMRSFENFKEANDERLEEIEKKLTADVVTSEKVERINAALDLQKKTMDEMALAARRPELGGARFDASAREHKSGWDAYMRRGEAASLKRLEEKALSAGSDPDGGYLVPEETERVIDRVVSEISPIRAIAGVRQIGAAVYKKPFTTEGAQAGWVGETDARPETTTPVLAELEFPAMELYAMPAATASLLDDAAVNIDQWLAEEVQAVFAEQESAAFVAGDGVKKPRGFLDYARVDDASWSWGNIGTLSTGVSGGFPASDPSDILIDLIYALKSGYRANAHFVMNRKTQGAIRKFKDADGNYIWQPGLAAGQPPRLMNFPIAEAEDMPDMAADAAAIAFGDFKRGYLIVDRLGVRVLRDPYTAKPYVLFYTTKRVGGGVQNFEAIKLLTFAA